MSNNYVNSKLINDATLLIKTRLRQVDEHTLSDSPDDSTFKGKSGKMIVKPGPVNPLAWRNGFGIWKSPVKLYWSAAWMNYITLRDGTTMGKSSDDIIEVKIGDYWYYVNYWYYTYNKDIKTCQSYYGFILSKEVTSQVTLEWFKCADCIARTEQDFIDWFEALPAISNTKYIQFGDFKPKLESTKKIATDKGWTLA